MNLPFHAMTYQLREGSAGCSSNHNEGVERSGWLACFGGTDTGRRFGTAYTGDEEGDELNSYGARFDTCQFFTKLEQGPQLLDLVDKILVV